MDKSIKRTSGTVSRSEQRIPKLRTRGRENRRRLMAEAQRLLLEGEGAPLRFSDVFEAAGVSRGSAYRIYIGIDDLLQDLATEWINNFVEFLKVEDENMSPDNWGELSDQVVERCADYWLQTSNTLRVMPRIRSNEPSSYREAVLALAEVNALLFNRHFVIPEVPDWLQKMAFYMQICDITFSDAVRSERHISEQRISEAQALCRTYLSFYLPNWLPPRDPVENG